MRISIRFLSVLACVVAVMLGTTGVSSAARYDFTLGVGFGPVNPDGSCVFTWSLRIDTTVDSFGVVSSLVPLKGKALKDSEPAVVAATDLGGISTGDSSAVVVPSGQTAFLYATAVRDGRVVAKETLQATC